jgi:hypothetical protein
MSEVIQRKLIYAFNVLFIDFLKDVRGTKKEIKSKTQKIYKVIDKLSDEMIEYFRANFGEHHDLFIASSNIVHQDDLQDTVIFGKQSPECEHSVTIKDIVTGLGEKEKTIINHYVFNLYIISYLYAKLSDTKDVDTVTTLFDDYVNKSSHTKHHEMVEKMEDDDSSEEAVDVEDANYRQLVANMTALQATLIAESEAEVEAEAEAEGAKASGGGNPFDFMENSKIGQLAKEISSSINLESLNINNPEDITSVEGLFSGNNNALTNIIQQVGTSIASKIQSGDIKQEDLLGEAMGMMQQLNMGGGGDAGGFGGMEGLMKGMMSMMSQGGGGFPSAGAAAGGGGGSSRSRRRQQQRAAAKNAAGTSTSSSTARDRLRRRLEKKQQQQKDEEEAATEAD